MLGTHDPGLRISRTNEVALREQAQLLQQPYEYYINSSVEFGVVLGGMVQAMLPESLTIAFRTGSDPVHKLYNLNFVDEEPPKPLDPALAALDAEFTDDREFSPLPMDPSALAHMTRMAYELGVQRREYFASSVFYYHEWALTHRNNSQAYIGLPDGSYEPLSPDA